MLRTRTAVVGLVIAVGAAVGVPLRGSEAVAAARPAQPSGEAREGRVDLRPRFSPGQRIRYTMEVDSTTDTTSDQMPELDGKQNLRQEITFVFRVVEAGSDGSTIEMVYERVKVDLDSEGFKASYDSARPAPPNGTGPTPRERTRGKPRRSPPEKALPSNDPDALPGEGVPADLPTLADMSDDEMLAAAMQGIAGTVVTIELDTAGNITAVRGTESLSGGGSGLGGMLGGAGGVGGVPMPSKGASGPWSISSPGQSGFARVGETWSTTSSLGNTPLGALQMVTRYTLRSAAGGRATIAINGGIEGGSSGSPGGGPGGGGGAQIREASYSGQCIWDTNEGQLREMTTSQSATIEGAGLGVPMVMKSKTDMRVRRVR